MKSAFFDDDDADALVRQGRSPEYVPNDPIDVAEQDRKSTSLNLLRCCSVEEENVLQALKTLTLPTDMAYRKVLYSVLLEFFRTHPSKTIRLVI